MAKSIRVSMPDFTITVLEDGAVVREITDCGFGRREGNNNQTPAIAGANLSSWKRKIDYKSGKYPPPHGGAPMPYALFLEQNLAIAFHEGDPFGESHGCMHLNHADASWLFAWAGAPPHADPVAVDIVGPHPVPGVRARTYRVGATNMLPRVVAAIQAVLVAEGFLPAGHGPQYDAATAAAVTAYQTAHGIGIDGKVGPETALKMGVKV